MKIGPPLPPVMPLPRSGPPLPPEGDWLGGRCTFGLEEPVVQDPGVRGGFGIGPRPASPQAAGTPVPRCPEIHPDMPKVPPKTGVAGQTLPPPVPEPMPVPESAPTPAPTAAPAAAAASTPAPAPAPAPTPAPAPAPETAPPLPEATLSQSAEPAPPSPEGQPAIGRDPHPATMPGQPAPAALPLPGPDQPAPAAMQGVEAAEDVPPVTAAPRSVEAAQEAPPATDMPIPSGPAGPPAAAPLPALPCATPAAKPAQGVKQPQPTPAPLPPGRSSPPDDEPVDLRVRDTAVPFEELGLFGLHRPPVAVATTPAPPAPVSAPPARHAEPRPAARMAELPAAPVARRLPDHPPVPRTHGPAPVAGVKSEAPSSRPRPRSSEDGADADPPGIVAAPGGAEPSREAPATGRTDGAAPPEPVRPGTTGASLPDLVVAQRAGQLFVAAAAPPLDGDGRALLRRLVREILAGRGLSLADFRLNGAPLGTDFQIITGGSNGSRTR